jgi:predicted PurR-regulated permease PerM
VANNNGDNPPPKTHDDPRDAPARRASASDDRVRGWIVTALFVLAVFYTLYLTRELTLPIVLALLLSFLFRPVVSALHRLRVPLPLASALVVLALMGAVAGAGYALAEPASLWLQKSPQIVRDLERKLRPIREKVQEVRKAAQQVEKITNVDQVPKQQAVAVQVRGPSMRAIVLERAQQLVTGAVFVFFLLYFLLSTWESTVDRLAALASTNQGRQNVRNIVIGIERNVSRYLGAVTLISVAMGCLTALLMYILGMPNPLLWGALAGVLNFIPYIGPMVTLCVLTAVALLSFDTPGEALLVSTSYLLLETLEGQLFTPFMLGRSLALNPVLIFLGIIFWGWLWGPAGALLAVPILMTLKIVCARVQPLAALTPILSR